MTFIEQYKESEREFEEIFVQETYDWNDWAVPFVNASEKSIKFFLHSQAEKFIVGEIERLNEEYKKYAGLQPILTDQITYWEGQLKELRK